MSVFSIVVIALEAVMAALLAGLVFLLAKPKQTAATVESLSENRYAEEETAAHGSSESNVEPDDEPLGDIYGEETANEIQTDDGSENDEDSVNDIVFAETAAEEATAEDATANSVPEVYRLAKSFTAKLILSAEELKARYSEIKNTLLSYKKVKARTSWKCETFRRGHTVLAKFMIRGKTLCLYLALTPEDIPDEKYKVESVKRKASAITPTVYKIKNARRVKNAKQLMAILAEKFSLTAFERQTENYVPAYQTEEELLNRGLIRKVRSASFNGR